jgi:hypothetical protein
MQLSNFSPDSPAHQSVRRRHDEDKELLSQLLKSNDQSGRAAVA